LRALATERGPERRPVHGPCGANNFSSCFDFRLATRERIISHLVSTRTDRRRTGGYRRGSLQPHARWSVWEGAHCSRRPSGGFSGGPAKAGFPCKPSSDPRILSVLVTAPYAMHQWVIARHLFCSVRGILLSDAVLGQA